MAELVKREGEVCHWFFFKADGSEIDKTESKYAQLENGCIPFDTVPADAAYGMTEVYNCNTCDGDKIDPSNVALVSMFTTADCSFQDRTKGLIEDPVQIGTCAEVPADSEKQMKVTCSDGNPTFNWYSRQGCQHSPADASVTGASGACMPLPGPQQITGSDVNSVKVVCPPSSKKKKLSTASIAAMASSAVVVLGVVVYVAFFRPKSGGSASTFL